MAVAGSTRIYLNAFMLTLGLYKCVFATASPSCCHNIRPYWCEDEVDSAQHTVGNAMKCQKLLGHQSIILHIQTISYSVTLPDSLHHCIMMQADACTIIVDAINNM